MKLYLRATYGILLLCSFLSSTLLHAQTGGVGIGTVNPATDVEIVADTFAVRNAAAWDNLWFTVDGYRVGINASGVDSGLTFRLGRNATGAYGDSQTLKDVMHLQANGTVGIGTVAPDTNAALDISSSSKGILMPRLTTQAMNAIVNPPKGMMVYNTDMEKFMGYAGGPLIQVSQPSGTDAISTTSSIGQSFDCATSSFQGGSIDVYVSYPSPVTLTLKLYAGTSPTGSPVGTSTYTISGGNFELAHFQLPANVPSNPLTFPPTNIHNYTFNVALPSGSTGNLQFECDNNHPYTSGAVFNNGVQNGGVDLRFYIRKKDDSGWREMND